MQGRGLHDWEGSSDAFGPENAIKTVTQSSDDSSLRARRIRMRVPKGGWGMCGAPTVIKQHAWEVRASGPRFLAG